MRICIGIMLLFLMSFASAEDCRRVGDNVSCAYSYELEPFETERRWVFFTHARPERPCRAKLLSSEVYQPGVIVQSKTTHCAPTIAVYEMINFTDEHRSGRVILLYGAP